MLSEYEEGMPPKDEEGRPSDLPALSLDLPTPSLDLRGLERRMEAAGSGREAAVPSLTGGGEGGRRRVRERGRRLRARGKTLRAKYHAMSRGDARLSGGGLAS
jgi:hypothetical protein